MSNPDLEKNSIQVGFNKAHKWHHQNSIWFIGYFFDNENTYLTGNNAIRHFLDCSRLSDFKNRLLSADGIYSVIIQQGDKILAASDRSRFFPLFYTQKADRFYLSDNFYKLVQVQPNIAYNTEAISEFLSSAYTHQSNTLVNNIFQIRPGEVIVYENLRVKKEYFTSMVTNKKEFQTKKYGELLDSGFTLFEHVRERLINSIKDKNVLLPLSAGFDSRLIAAWLKQSGIENVTCFTFGRKDAPEAAKSKEVAEILGYKWHFIEYNNELIKGFKETDEFDYFFKYLSRGTSMFYMQEFFAIRELINQEIVSGEHVVIPGHSGDFLGGSQLKKTIPANLKNLHIGKQLIKQFFIHFPLETKQKERLNIRLNQHLEELSTLKANSQIYSIIEDWFVKEKIAKYVINSAHAFTFYDMEIRLPFWDNTLFEHWRTVPVKYRKNKKLYDEILVEKYFKPLNIYFKNEQQPTPKDITIYNIKKRIRPYLSLETKHKLLKKNDWVFYDEITSCFLDDLNKKEIRYKDNGTSYLYRILYWYIMRLEEEYFV